MIQRFRLEEHLTEWELADQYTMLPHVELDIPDAIFNRWRKALLDYHDAYVPLRDAILQSIRDGKAIKHDGRC